MELLRKNKNIIYLLIFIWIALIYLLVYSNKNDLHILMNSFHSDFFDTFFRIITQLGDGLIITILAIIVGLFNFGRGIYLLSAHALSGMFAQLLKKTIFKGIPRPAKALEGIYDLHFVDSVNLHHFNSFPSGHTVTAFTFFFGLALLVENKFLKFLFVLIACLVGYSRIYLSQHFLIDVYAGSIIGVIFAIGFYQLVYKQLKNKKIGQISLFRKVSAK